MAVFLMVIILFYLTGCSTRYIMYKDTLTTELVTVEELPHYNKVTVCQGPAVLYLSTENLFCIVRCYDSNNDARMLSRKQSGIDVFEYNLLQSRHHNGGQFYRSVDEVPYTVIVDLDFDGKGDFIYLFRAATAEGHFLYEKIKIRNHHLVMDDFAPASFRPSDFKSSSYLNRRR